MQSEYHITMTAKRDDLMSDARKMAVFYGYALRGKNISCTVSEKDVVTVLKQLSSSKLLSSWITRKQFPPACRMLGCHVDAHNSRCLIHVWKWKVYVCVLHSILLFCPMLQLLVGLHERTILENLHTCWTYCQMVHAGFFLASKVMEKEYLSVSFFSQD